MKPFVLTILTFTILNLVFLGLQAGLYFLPFSAPAFWMVILCYYCYSRSIFTVLLLNIILTVLMSEFSSVPPGPFIVVVNTITILANFIQHRFHLTDGQIMLSAAGGILISNIGLWFLQLNTAEIFRPNILAWVACSLATLAIAPLIFYPLRKFDQTFCQAPQEGVEYLLI